MNLSKKIEKMKNWTGSFFKIIKKYKFDISWFLMTVLFVVFVSITQMYSRAVTLDKVDKKNFHLVYKLINEHNIENKQKVSESFSPFLTKNKYALFHFAIVKKSSCDEITTHYYNRPYICDMFENTSSIVLDKDINITSYKVQEFKSNNITDDEKIYESYLFQKLRNSDSWLIGKGIFYSENSRFDYFKYFLSHRYIQANGIAKIFDKGKYLALVIILFSFAFWIGLKIYFYRQKLKYFQIKNREKILQHKWNQLDSRLNDIKNEQYDKDMEILELEEKIKNMTSSSSKEKKVLNSYVDKLKQVKNQLEKSIDGYKQEIKAVENDENDLHKKMNNQLLKLSQNQKDSENLKMQEKNILLEQLWRHEPTWTDRKFIESFVALKETHIPFTITQGFIAFDHLIFSYVKKYFPEVKENDNTLFENIKIIFDHQMIPARFEKDMHNIRKARNKWFHYGIYPDMQVIDVMIDLLQKTNISPKL